jgi:hypothetical protein
MWALLWAASCRHWLCGAAFSQENKLGGQSGASLMRFCGRPYLYSDIFAYTIFGSDYPHRRIA